MANNYTPELNPDKGTQQNPCAAAFFDDTLWYIGNGHDSTVWVVYRSVAASSLDSTEASDKEAQYWKQYVLDDQPGFQTRASISRQPALAVAGNYMYFIWIQDESHDDQPTNSVWATRYTPTGKPGTGTWSRPVRLFDDTTTPLSISESNFAVMGWGDYLVGCYRGEVVVMSTLLLVYDTSAWSAGDLVTWKPIATWYNSFAEWPNFPPPSAIGNQISMDWFALNGDKVYYIISFFNAETSDAYVFHAMNVLPFDQWSQSHCFLNWSVEHWTGVTQGVHVIREPGGRMLGYHASPHGHIVVRMMPTGDVSADGNLWSTFGSPYFLFGQELPVDQAPVPAFVWGAPTTKQVSITVTDQQGQPVKETRTETIIQAYQFVMFKKGGIRLVFSHYGQAIRIPNAYTMSMAKAIPPTGEQRRLMVTGIVDSPLPLPAVNVKSRPVYSTQYLGNVDYGTTASTGDSRSASWSWSAGFISAGHASTGGGPAWDISFSAGMAGAAGHSTTDQIIQAVKAETNVTAQNDIGPYGMLALSSVIFHRDAYAFYDLSLTGDTYTAVTDAVVPTMVWITDTGPENPSFTPYTVTAGDLWSYTRAGWNARMKQLGYAGDDYFGDVIEQRDSAGNYVNAVVFDVGGEDNPYLEFAWSTGGQIKQAFKSIDQSYDESGWHLDASAYVGWSWGVGATVFGIGEKEVFDFMAGGSYSRSTQKKTTEGGSWGLTVSYDLQDPPPPPLRYPGEIVAFSWRLYLLKANKLWTEELLSYANPESYSKGEIDPGSSPWRILFEVVENSIHFKGDTQNVVYRDAAGDVIELWYYTEQTCGTPTAADTLAPNGWHWINVSKEAVEYGASATASPLPSAASNPCWFAWGMSKPGYLPYTQAVVFRAADGDLCLLWGVRAPTDQDPAPPGNTNWQWRSLAGTEGFVKAVGDPVGYRWEQSPWGADLHVIYRGVDGDLHELWAFEPNGTWHANNITRSVPQKPASDPTALVWDRDPGGASEQVVYRSTGNEICALSCSKAMPQWTLTNVSAVTKDGATPTGRPSAFVWDQGANTSLHIGYRGSDGSIHELYRDGAAWQPADDPSWDAHATAETQLAAGDPVGFAWQRSQGTETIHWVYRTNQENHVGELWRGDGGPSTWAWNDLSRQASGGVGESAGTHPPPVAQMLPGFVWAFDPVMGSSMHVYFIGADQHVYEIWYDVPNLTKPDDGLWKWNDLSALAQNAADQSPPPADLPCD